MHQFDNETFKLLLNNNKDNKDDIIEYIKNCIDKEIKVNEFLYFNNLITNGNIEILIELVKKRFQYNNYQIINELIFNERISSDIIISAIEIYKDNNWLIDNYDIIGKLLHYKNFRKEEDNIKLYDYAIKLYEYLNLSPEKYDILSNTGKYIENKTIYKLLNYYKYKNYKIKKNIISDFSFNYKIYKYRYDANCVKELNDVIDFLIENNLDVFTNIYDLPSIIASYRDWNTLKKVLDIYIQNDIKFNCNICIYNNTNKITTICENNLLYIISKYFPLDAVKYILNYCEKNNQDIYKKTRDGYNFIDYIIQYNNIEVLKYILEKKYNITNNTLEVYSPCHNCHNGEQNKCNFHTIDTEFIAIKRYGVELSDLDKITKDEYELDFYYLYHYFCYDQECTMCQI